MDKAAAIESVRRDLLGLTASPLYEYRRANGYVPVVGDGNLDARIMFIGEAPGKKEAETGKPFAGAAGKMLDKLLASVGISRSDVYITNIVNDRPPDNRDPKPEELALYSPFLLRVIGIVDPRVLVTLGRFSTGFILQTLESDMAGTPISSLHGKPVAVRSPASQAVVVPLYHPAVALYNGGMRKVLEEDFAVLKSYAGM